MPTLHSHTHCQVAQADPQAKTWQRVCLSNRTTKTTDKLTDEKEHRSDNIYRSTRNSFRNFRCTPC
jgi:hypothetical protein